MKRRFVHKLVPVDLYLTSLANIWSTSRRGRLYIFPSRCFHGETPGGGVVRDRTLIKREIIIFRSSSTAAPTIRTGI